MQEDTAPIPSFNLPQADSATDPSASLTSRLTTSQQHMICLNSAVPWPSTATRQHLDYWFKRTFPALAGTMDVETLSVCTLQEEPVPPSERVPNGPMSRRTVKDIVFLETLFWRAVAGQMNTREFFLEIDNLEVVVTKDNITQVPGALNSREAKEEIKRLLNTTPTSYERLLARVLDDFWNKPADFTRGRNVGDWLAEELGTQLRVQADLHLLDTTLSQAMHKAVTDHLAAQPTRPGVFSLSLTPQGWGFSLPVPGAVVLTRPDHTDHSADAVLYRPGHPLEVHGSLTELKASLKEDDNVEDRLDTAPIPGSFLVHLVSDLRAVQKAAVSNTLLNGPTDEEEIAAWVSRLDAAADIGDKLDLAGAMDERELRLNLKNLNDWLHHLPHITGDDRLAWWRAAQALHSSLVDTPPPADPVTLATAQALRERTRRLLAGFIGEKYPPADPEDVSLSIRKELIDPHAPTGTSPFGSGVSQGGVRGVMDDRRSMTEWAMSNLTQDERNAAQPTVVGPLSFAQIVETIERANIGTRLAADVQLAARKSQAQWMALKAQQIRAQAWTAHISGDLRHDKDNTGLNLVLAALDSPAPDRRAKVNGHDVVVRQLQWGNSVLKSILAFGVKTVSSRPSLTLYTPGAPDGKVFRDVDAASGRTLESTLAQTLTATPQMTRWLISQLPLLEQAVQLASMVPASENMTFEEKIRKVTQSAFVWARVRAQNDFATQISSPVVEGNLLQALYETQITHAMKTADMLTVTNAERDSTAAREGRRNAVMLLTGAMSMAPAGRLGGILGRAILPTMAAGAAVAAIDVEGGHFSQWTRDFISGLGEVIAEAGQDLIMARARRHQARPALSSLPRMPDPELEPFHLRGFDSKGLIPEGRNRYRDTRGQGYLSIGKDFFKSAIQGGERIIYAPNNRTNQRTVTWRNGGWQVEAQNRLLGGGALQSLLGRSPETPQQKRCNILLESALADQRRPSVELVNTVKNLVDSMPDELVVRILHESMEDVGMRDLDSYRAQINSLYQTHVVPHANLRHKINIWMHVDTATKVIESRADGFSLTATQQILIFDKIEILGPKLFNHRGEFNTAITILPDNVTGAVFLAITPERGKKRNAVHKIADAHTEILDVAQAKILDELEPLFPGSGPDVEAAKRRYVNAPERQDEYKIKFINAFSTEMRRRNRLGLLTEIRQHEIPYIIANKGKSQRRMMVVTEEEITKFTRNLSSYDAFDIEVVTQARTNRVTGTRPPTTPPASAVPSPATDKFTVDTSPLADTQMSYDNFPETARAKVVEIMDDIRAGRVTTKRINQYYWYDMARLVPGGGRGLWRAAFERQGDTWTLQGFYNYHVNKPATVWGD